MAEINRNTNIGAKGLWEWGSEPIKRFRWYSRFQDGRKLVEDDERGGHPKSNWTEVNTAAVADLVKKNDRRIASRMISEYLNIPKTLVFRILKEDLGKRKLSARFAPLLDTWAKRRSSHILARHYRDGRCRQNFFNKIIMGDKSGVLPMTPKQNDRVLNGLVRRPLGWRNWNSKGPASRPCW